MKPESRPGRDAYFSAVDYLSRREHSRVELESKLLKKGFTEEAVADALEQLLQHDLQSDQRFVEDFVRSKLLKGYGPLKLAQELRLKGVNENLLNICLEEQEIDWFEQAKATYFKKYKENSPIDLKEKAKRARFMQSKGFPSDIIFDLFD